MEESNETTRTDILLVQPVHTLLPKNFAGRDQWRPSFPWALAYLSAAMAKNGFSTGIIDSNALQLDNRALVDRIKSQKFTALGISAFSTQYAAFKTIVKEVRRFFPGPVILGGPLATYNHRLALEKNDIDVCVLEEGELTLPDLMQNLDALEKVAGIAYRHEGGIFETARRPYVKDLDALPVIDYTRFDMPAYIGRSNSFLKDEKGKKPDNGFAIPTSRGCPYKCRFCSRNFSGLRRMKPERVIRELGVLTETYGVDAVSFQDELFLARPRKELQAICGWLKEKGIKWFCQARINMVTEELLHEMKDAGCTGIGYGIESGSQKILDNMRKEITVAQIEKAMKIAKDLGMNVKVQLMIGYEGEDEKTIKETVELIRRCNDPGRRFLFFTPLPGSPKYESLMAEGRIPDEEAYLLGLDGDGGHTLHFNASNLGDKKLKRLKRRAEIQMFDHYHNIPVFLRWLKETKKMIFRQNSGGI